MIHAIHLSEDQLIEHLYCESEVVVEHLNACSECRDRFTVIEGCRTQLAAHQSGQPSRSEEFFQGQRRAIASRIDNARPRSPFGNIWVPSSLALLLAVGMVVGRTYTAASTQVDLKPAVESTNDFLEILEPGWFDETYTAMQIAEPLAASPIVNLFAQQPARE
jgi:predicted anti-sigma-YlaC factor YlaD